MQQLGRNLEVAEVKVHREGPLASCTLDESEVGARTGATVIGQWSGGELAVAGGPGLVLQPGGILVVVGSPESVDRLQELSRRSIKELEDLFESDEKQASG